MPQQFESNSIFWVEVDKIRPNPYQPRTEFDEARLKDLSDSIRQYGVLQPLVVTRHEEQKEDGGIATYYELIAGERRLRASKLAGLAQVPVVIRSNEESERSKLEMAIIENLQREDLNAIDRARAFQRLAQEFKLNMVEIGKKIGKSREYVSNSMRLLTLPPEIQSALKGGAIYEGHARALLMLADRPEEMMTVFRDITIRKMSVRDVEKATREIAWEKARKRSIRPEIEALERSLAESLGTKVEIREQEGVSGGGKLIIDFFSADDLEAILAGLGKSEKIAPPVSPPPDTQEPGSSQPDSDSFSLEDFSV
jgi:ParB family chromosome partitioning protein